MKCDHIRTRKQGDTPFFPNMLNNGNVEVCLKEDVDAAIEELREEILNLKAKNIELQSFYDLHGNVDNYIDKLEAEKVKLKQKLENVQASMYADVVDANMENRRLKRALWLTRAERASDKALIFYFAMTESYNLNINGYSDKEKGHTRMHTAKWWRLTWLKVERKCRAKAEEYK